MTEQTAENFGLSGLTDKGARDEFFYLCAINRATLVTNAAQGLVAPDKAPVYARAIDEVTKHDVRTDRVIKLEPQLIAIAGPELTELHVGRSSQDMHSTYRLSMLRDDVLAVHQALSSVIDAFTTLAEKFRDAVVPNYTNGVAAQPNSLANDLPRMSRGFLLDRERLRELHGEHGVKRHRLALEPSFDGGKIGI